MNTQARTLANIHSRQLLIRERIDTASRILVSLQSFGELWTLWERPQDITEPFAETLKRQTPPSVSISIDPESPRITFTEGRITRTVWLRAHKGPGSLDFHIECVRAHIQSLFRMLNT